ncbi:MAG: VWA domain-containing protein [Vicinamibacterales bacterium]
MTALRRQLAYRTAAACLLAAVPLATGSDTQAQRFTARVDAVRIDVRVQRGGQPVTGLTAADFDVRDKGVLQQVTIAASEATPVDVTLALDVSGSVRGERLTRLRAAGLTLIDALQPTDHAALITFASQVTLRQALTPRVAQLRTALDVRPESGNTALIDALQTAMVTAESGTGRPLVIVFSDGAETGSFLQTAAVEDTARRMGMVVYGVTTSGTAPSALRSVARLTGGETSSADSSGRLDAQFARILDEFRHLYVLSYTPNGTPTPGWHDVTVRLKSAKGDVRARPGYLASQ